MFIDFKERGRGTERETERNIEWLPPIPALTGDQTQNLCMCPGWGLNLQLFGMWDNAPTN